MTSPLPKHIRRELARIGYRHPDRADLAAFQAARGIKTEKPGVVDVKTKQALDLVADYAKKHESVFMRGMSSGAIRSAEARLKALGYDAGKADGVFDKATADALQTFKKDHPSLKNTYRFMGKQVRGLLADEAKARAHAPYHQRVGKKTKTHERLDAATAKVVQGEGVGVGAPKSRAVKNIELRLRAAGFNPQKADGRFDERTASAVKAFQKKANLPVTGTVDAPTWAQLKRSYVYGEGRAMTVGERSSSVRKAEVTLRKLGFKSVKADGVFDTKTAAAVRRFERKHHLKVNGDISPREVKLMKKAAAEGKGTDAFAIAKKMIGKSAMWLQTHGPLGKFMTDGVPQNVNCANFVSSCLQHAKLISNGQHDNTVSGLSRKLGSDKDWKRTSLSNAKPGDVCVVNGGGHVVMFAGRDRNGNPLFIGSNNRMNVAGHPQYVSVKGGYTPSAVYHYQG